MVKIESKEKLAKLLAIEDLDIQHQQVETAMFDITNRILILPIWEDMSNDLYDLFVGHEIGHALFTPTNPEKLRSIIDKTAKDYVNVIEDARIESLIKRRYPGLKKSFFKGYNDLVKRGFFDLDKIDIHTSTLIDKINIRFKIPQYCDITFNKEEQSYVDRIIESKTFEDIEGIIIDVFEYDKKAKENQEQEQDFDSVEPANKEEDCEKSDYSSEGGDIQYNNKKEEEKLTEEEEKLTEEEEAFNKYMDSSVEDQVEDQTGNNSTDATQETSYNDKEMISKTQRHFEERVQDTFINNCSNNIYVNVPENINLKNAVEDFKSVHSKINKFYKDNLKQNSTDTLQAYFSDEGLEVIQTKIYNDAKDMLRRLKKDSVKTVNHIAMEFERKKAADVYKKTSISKTGILDTNKLFSAKYNDDVFKKNIRVPDGKNHGLVMFIDWSGSMASNIHECIKQVIELTFFCKKVNIPFEVYSFTDAPYHRHSRQKNDPHNHSIFNYKHGDFVCDRNMKVRNYLSSRMTTKEYNNAVLNLCILANRFGKGRYTAYPAHNDDELFTTPLSGAILISEYIIRNFKKKNNLESVHAVWLTDGEGNIERQGMWNAKKQDVEGKLFRHLYYNNKESNPVTIFLKDKKTKKDYRISTRRTSFILFDIIKERLGINIVGFFILPDFTSKLLWRFVPKSKDKNISYQQNQTNYKDWIKSVRKRGYFVKTESGYDEYYVLNGAGKNIKNEVIDNKMTTRKMVSVFSQKNKQFKAKRIILSRFVDLITAK